jgi:beta-lactamase class A
LDDAIVSAAVSRRALLAAGAGLVASCATAAPKGEPDLAALEARSGGRLGVFVLDTGSGRSYGHRAAERFTMCSTFKLPLAGLVLLAGARGEFDINARRPIVEADRVPFAPVAGPLIGKGDMSLREMAQATQTTSDNICANILMCALGGPEGVTARLRALGDAETRLDRYEPSMNFAPPGEVRDTTTPRAMAATMRRLLLDDVLPATARDELIGWMIATKTGLKRLRAGLPADWRAGDKTGTGLADGMTDKINDIAIFWPPGRAPIIVTAYFDSARASQETQAADQAVLAEVGRIAAVNI